MHYSRMIELIEEEFDAIREIRATKGKEYAGEEDTLADFKEVAVETGTTPLQVWNTYVKKHVRAVDTYIREGEVKSESIEGRIRDVIVYHLLLLGLVEDLADGDCAEDMERPIQYDAPTEVADHRCAATWGSCRCALPIGHHGQHLGGDAHDDDRIRPDVRWDHDGRRVLR